jgi:hypothetical protein
MMADHLAELRRASLKPIRAVAESGTSHNASAK